MDIEKNLDVLRARESARMAGKDFDFDDVDQIRIATGVSELARVLYQFAGGGKMIFSYIDDKGKTGLELICEAKNLSIKNGNQVLSVVKKLVDKVEIKTEGNGLIKVSIIKWLKDNKRFSPEELREISNELEEKTSAYSLDKLQIENQELIKLLDELKRSKKELEKSKEKLQRLSITDPLTGVYNRRFLYNFLKKEFERAKRYNLSLSCLMVDIDHFKNLNDTYGHRAGDLMLKKLTAFLKKKLRKIDLVARYGGEEFVIVLPETPLKMALVGAERMRKGVEEEMQVSINGESIRITISIGVSSFTQQEKDEESLIRKADEALYRAKKWGRNRVEK